MILEKEFMREEVVLYARKYALTRNPLFYTFEGIGGNCTNFASQCVLAGSCTMNYTAVYGWYYLSINRRSASWTGVDYFFDFMTTNQGVGPYGRVITISEVQPADLIQLQNSEGRFYHTLVVTKVEDGEIYICANSNDALDRPLSSYDYASLRVIRIDAVRYDTRYVIDCFEALYSPPVELPQNTPQGETPSVSEPVPEEPSAPTPTEPAPQEEPSAPTPTEPTPPERLEPPPSAPPAEAAPASLTSPSENEAVQ